jgi:hypothetical protein
MKNFAAKKKWGVVVFSFLFLFGNNNFVYAAGPYEFGIPIESYYVKGAHPRHVISADLDGDNDQDLIVVKEPDNTVSIFKNNGDGTFASKVDYETGYEPYFVVAADIDIDGDQDLVVVNHFPQTFSILKNNGDGTFASKVDYNTNGSPSAVSAADLDGDGDKDLMITNEDTNTVSIFKNSGEGIFFFDVNYDTGNYPSSIVSSDMDGDGDSDIVVVNSGSNNVSIFKNNGDGTFAPKVDYETGIYPNYVISKDLDGDGDQDLAVAGYNENLSVFKNNGDGTFALRVKYIVEKGGSLFITSADFNGDGAPDLAVGGGSRSNNIFINKGDGTFDTFKSFRTGGRMGENFSATSADFDGDGDQDIAAVNYFSFTVSVIKNDSSGNFSLNTDYSTGEYPWSVVSADFDGDNDLDLAVVNIISNTLSIFKNTGDGVFSQKTDYDTGISPWSVASADFDGDGSFDLVIANNSSSNVSIFKNNGDGTFTTKVDYSTGSYPGFVTAADLDGDGDQDIVVGGSNISILKNNSDGTFATRVDYGMTGSNPSSVAVTDLDCDGDQDIVAVGGRGFLVLKNNGDGIFVSQSDYDVGAYWTSVTHADFDGDGDQDLAIITDNSMGAVSFLKNNGDGTFASKVDYETGGFPNYVISADFDGDGDQDIAVSNGDFGVVSIFKNNGDGTFASKVDYGVGGDWPSSVTSADFDGDGDQDIAVTSAGVNVGGNVISILKNGGSLSSPMNHGPVARNTSVITDKNVLLPIALLATDSDVPTQTLTYSIVSGPSHGTLGTIFGNKVTYTPATNYVGDDSFTFKVNDGKVDSNTGTVDIKVQRSTNIAPTLTPLSDDKFSDGIDPDKGVANKDLLTFKTIYTDQENVEPTKMDVVIRNTVDFDTDFYKEQFTLSDHAIVVQGSNINERFPQTTKFVGNDNWGNAITEGESVTATLKRENIYQATTTVIVDSSLMSMGEVSADILLEALNSSGIVVGNNRIHIPINVDIEKTKTVAIIATSTSPIYSLRFTAGSTNDTGVWIEKFELGETIPIVVDATVATQSLTNGIFSDGEQYTASAKFPKGKYSFNFETADSALLTSTESHNFTTGNSNIIFFPGIMGSRLFERSADCGSSHDVLPTERERWVAMQECDHEYLALDLAGRGKSVFQLYTKEGTAGAVDDTYSLNIYQSFMNDLDWWKNHDHIITDYSIIPYDWRLSLDDILQNGSLSSDGKLSYDTDQGFYSAYIFKQLKAMQESSDSGKVTIIAHSNGGLVTKALIQKLKDDNNSLANDIDDIIFVAVPQAGTPDAIGGLLYGTKLGPWGIVMSAEQSRDLLRYMPVGYNLLPSSSFGVSSFTSFIEFEGNAVSSAITTRYGNSIDTYDELADYLLGGDGRPEASYEDINSPARLNKRLLAQATSTHQILDNWKPATSTTVYEIAGWGLYTTEGFKYSKNKICEPGIFSSRQGKITIPCLGYHYEIKIEDRKTINGDATVVEKSAHLMQSSDMTKKYWVNLEGYNNEPRTIAREHKDIFEVDTLRPFIRSIVVNNITTQPFITDNNYSLTPSGREFVKYVIHSPLNLNVYDTLGNHTGISPEGMVENGIKGSQYSELGESKTIIVPAEIAHTLNLDAYASGSFTLDIETLIGDTITASTTFEAVPTATTTKANLVWDPQAGITPSTILNIDFNADNIVDVSLLSTPDGTTLYDITPPEVAISFSTTTNDMIITGTDEGGVSSVVTTTSKTTIIDKAGNTLVVPFIKYKDGKTKLKVVFEKLIYNGTVKNIPKTTLEYEWELNKNGTIKELEQDVVIKNTRRVSAEYESKKNETKITDKEKEKGEKSNVKSRKLGVVLFTISTQDGVVGVQY